ncbi:hypothetical protein [Fulvivirga sp.]|uniref:hypothetical protein n=1 Tax=Fulvivirga sp. TaxID=1931237 RepID=UPI0032EC479F
MAGTPNFPGDIKRVIKYCKEDHNIARNCTTLRLGSFEDYRNIEAQKLRDEKEGRASFNIEYMQRGNSEFRNVHILNHTFPNAFIFCTTMRKLTPDSFNDDYNDYYFINQPIRFFNILNSLLNDQFDQVRDLDRDSYRILRKGGECMPKSMVGKVNYNSKTIRIVKKAPNETDAMWLSYFSKPKHFFNDYEYRFVSTMIINRPEINAYDTISTSKSKILDLSDKLDEIKQIVSLPE